MKIMIVGRPGSGKSTFALELSKKLNLPLYHLDKYFFKANWVERDYAEFLSLQDVFVKSENWIIDGNSTKSYERRYSNADICLYFNFPKYLCYWRVFKRLLIKAPNIDDRADNCPETVRWSLLKYMWGFEVRVAKQLETLKESYPRVQFIELKNDKHVNRYLSSI